MGPKLIIKDNNYTKAWEKLLDETKSNPELNKEFAKNPVGVLNRVLFDSKSKLSAHHIDKANCLLFSILSNAKFMEWAEQYQKETISKLGNCKEATKEELTKIYKDVSIAMIQYADKEFLVSLFKIDPDKLEFIVKEHPGDWIHWGEDFVITIETAIALVDVAVAAVVFVVAWVAKESKIDILSRVELSKLSKSIVSAVEKQAKIIRDSGKLTQY